MRRKVLYELQFIQLGLKEMPLDIAEIFKPAITDRIFLKLSNRGQLDETHFDTDLHGTVLSEKGNFFQS